MKNTQSTHFLFILRSALVWASKTVALAALISFFYVLTSGMDSFDIVAFLTMLFGSIFLFVYWTYHFFLYATGPAFFLGIIQSFWFRTENENWGSPEDLGRFSIFSGMVFGLLCFPVAYIFAQSAFPWIGFDFILAGSILGGAFGAYTNKKKLLLRVVKEDGKKTPWKKIIFHYFLLIFSVALLESVFLKNKIWAIIPITPLPPSMVSNIPPGNARGAIWSGVFKLKLKSWKYTFDKNGTIDRNLSFAENDGLLIVKDQSGSEWKGGIDETGKFIVAGIKQNHDWETRVTVEGKFSDDNNFTYRVEKTDSYMNRIMSSIELGAGQRTN